MSVARRFGVRPYEVGFGFGHSLAHFSALGFAWHWRLWPLGAYVALRDEDLEALKTRHYLAMVVGGVAINIALGLGLILAVGVSMPTALLPLLVWVFGVLSLCAGLGNLIPVWPMDGWAALVLILRNRLNDSKPLRRLESYGGKIEAGLLTAIWVVWMIVH